MTETQLKQKAHRLYAELGAFHQKISDRFSYGVLDELVVLNGRTVLFEYKTPEGMRRPSKSFKMQEYTVNEIRKHGGEAYFVCSTEEIRRILCTGKL